MFIWRDASSEPIAPSPSFNIVYILVLLDFPSSTRCSIYLFASIHHFLSHHTFNTCNWQDRKLDNLPGTLGTSCVLCLCAGTVNLVDVLIIPTGSINLGSQLREILAAGLHHPFHLGVPNNFSGSSKTNFWCRCWGVIIIN